MFSCKNLKSLNLDSKCPATVQTRKYLRGRIQEKMTIVIMLLAPNTSMNVMKSPPLASLKLQVCQVFYFFKRPSGDLEQAQNSHFSVVYSFEVMLTCTWVPSSSLPPVSPTPIPAQCLQDICHFGVERLKHLPLNQHLENQIQIHPKSPKIYLAAPNPQITNNIQT